MCSGCVDNGSESRSPAGLGVAGSTARFTVQNDHLVVVEDRKISTFSLIDSTQPALVDEGFSTGARLETIFPYQQDFVLLGTNQGALIIKITDTGLIESKSFATHFTSRDPVVASGRYMYVTIRPEANSNQSAEDTEALTDESNRLIIYDISDIENPIELRQLAIQEPRGLSISNERLYVCFDGGLRIYDTVLPDDPQLISDYANFPCEDVIADNDNLIITSPLGIQLLKNQQDNINLQSSILADI